MGRKSQLTTPMDFSGNWHHPGVVVIKVDATFGRKGGEDAGKADWGPGDCQAKEILLYPDTNLCQFTGGQANPLVMLSRVFIPLCPTTDI